MRGSDPGKDFDAQWEWSHRRGKQHAADGVGPWATDKALQRINQEAEKQRRKHAAPVSDNCVVAAAVLGGLAWAASEIVKRVLS